MLGVRTHHEWDARACTLSHKRICTHVTGKRAAFLLLLLLLLLLLFLLLLLLGLLLLLMLTMTVLHLKKI